MTLRSMTGYAQAEGAHSGTKWRWEVRSVNGRGLDVRLRLPPGFETLELKVREAIPRHINRGNVTLTLHAEREVRGGEVRLNATALESVLLALEQIRASGDFDKPRPEAVLAIKGVLETAETDEDDAQISARNAALLSDLDLALARLADARAAEGGRLGTILMSQVTAIETLTARAAASPSRQPEQVKARLRDQLSRLTDAAPGLDPVRLHQEVALIATKIDIEEEIARLNAHSGAARELLMSSAPVGRRLDFLSQEFNREANTLCSKSNDVELTRIGLELKATIDQLREQVQNIE